MFKPEERKDPGNGQDSQGPNLQNSYITGTNEDYSSFKSNRLFVFDLTKSPMFRAFMFTCGQLRQGAT